MRIDGRPWIRALAAAIRSAAGPLQLTLILGLLALSSCASSDDGTASPDDTVAQDTTAAVDATADPSCDDDRKWTAGADATANYVDFVQLGSGQFVHAAQDVGVLDEPDLGPVVAAVCLELSEVTFTGPFGIEPGDAAYLAAGTEIREIVGSDPSLRVGVVVDGRVRIYEVWDRPDAVVGGQLIDLGANIDEIMVSDDGGDTVLASVTEPAAVEALVAAVRTAPVDRSRPPGPPFGQPDHVVEFRRSDGTTTRRSYRPESGWLEPAVVLPEEARLLLLGLIANADGDVDPEVAVGTMTTGSATTATAGEPPGEDVDPGGFIPVPVNEAEGTLRFDFGAIVGTSIEGDLTWIQFDRYQLADGTNGPDLTEEVRFEGATDLPWVNENSRFRWYPLAPDVEVLELEADWFNILCDGEPGDVAFAPSTLTRLLALDARLVSLTLVDREVVRIRDQRSC